MKINNNQNTHFETIKVKPIAGALGAQIDNIDLSFILLASYMYYQYVFKQ